MTITFDPGATLRETLHPIPPDALAGYLRAHVEPFDGDVAIEQFQGGQSNPTYKVTTGRGKAERRYVLRRKPPGHLLPSAHAVEREFRILSALARSEVPVPHMYALCEDPSVIGTAFFVMEFVEGRILWDPTLPGMTRGQRAAHYAELNRVIAALHCFDYQGAGLADFGKPGNYVERQIGRWTKQYQAAAADRIPSMDRLIEWLPHNVPPGDETCVVHGDYRIDNVIFHPTEPRVLAVLDWELSTLGHPLSDFAYQVMAWRLGQQEFRGLRGNDLEALGIPTEEQYVAEYCRRTGRDAIANWDVYLIFNMFRIAAILHGVLARALQGNAASRNAIETGSRARLVADVAWEMAKGIDG